MCASIQHFLHINLAEARVLANDNDECFHEVAFRESVPELQRSENSFEFRVLLFEMDC